MFLVSCVQWLQYRGGVVYHGHSAPSAPRATAGQGGGLLGEPGVGASRGQPHRGAAQIHTRDPGGQQREWQKQKHWNENLNLFIANRKAVYVFIFLC